MDKDGAIKVRKMPMKRNNIMHKGREEDRCIVNKGMCGKDVRSGTTLLEM